MRLFLQIAKEMRLFLQIAKKLRQKIDSQLLPESCGDSARSSIASTKDPPVFVPTGVKLCDDLAIISDSNA